MVLNCTVCGRPACEIDELALDTPRAGIVRRTMAGLGLSFDAAAFKALLDADTLPQLINLRCPAGTCGS